MEKITKVIQSNKAITLISLQITVAVLAILAAIVVVTVDFKRNKG